MQPFCMPGLIFECKANEKKIGGLLVADQWFNSNGAEGTDLSWRLQFSMQQLHLKYMILYIVHNKSLFYQANNAN